MGLEVSFLGLYRWCLISCSLNFISFCYFLLFLYLTTVTLSRTSHNTYKMAKIHLSVYMTVIFLLLCSISWVQSETMRSRAALKLAHDRDEYVDRLFLETLDQEEQLKLQKQESIETWNSPGTEEDEGVFAVGLVKGSDTDILDSLNDELEVETYEFMRDSTEWDSDDDLNDGRDEW